MTQKDFNLLGKLVYFHQPDNARELLSKISDTPEGSSDFALMPAYFKEFKKHRNLSEEPRKKSRQSRQRIAHLKVFIAAMMHIYIPQVYHFKKIEPIKKGFSKNLGQTIGKNASSLSAMISEVIIMEKVYDSFREEVNQFIEIIQNIDHE